MTSGLAFAVLASTASGSVSNTVQKQNVVDARPITGVVKQLQAMADKSKVDGEEEADLFQKFKCYCTKTLTNTSKEMDLLGDEIEKTNNQITGFAAMGGEMSQKRAALEADMKANVMYREEATVVRDKSHEAFVVAEKDLVDALDQLNQALDTLGKVGGKPSAGLIDVAAVIEKSRPKNFRGSLVQVKQEGPGGVEGVLFSTRDTYVTNLAELRKTEEAELTAYTKIQKAKKDEHTYMGFMLGNVDSGIADVKTELGNKREQVAEAKDNLEKVTAFNQETDKLCKEKTAINEERATLRAQEDAALAKAIAVLNSDEAFSTFGKTKTTGLLQMKTIHMIHSAVDQRRPVVLKLLETAAHNTQSARLASIAALVGVQNPFDKVLTEIDNMQTHINQEGKKDKQKLKWCEEERQANNNAHKEKSEQIVELTSSIDTLERAIQEMTVSVDGKTAELANNDKEQKTQTELRKSENVEYQKNVQVLIQTQGIIEKGTKILKAYYDSIAKPALVQVKANQKTKATKSTHGEPPKVNDGVYNGQNGMGATVIQLLNDIMADTKAEETETHKAEQDAQKSFEDGMQTLTDEEASLKEAITQTKGDLAQAQLDTDNKKANLADTKNEKVSIETYLSEIKSDCDFIVANFNHRDASRAAESKALAAAIDAIQGTPAYKKAEKAKSLE
eukprot:TRINITY_DN93639_c0_g1_i1.p1 TRINITY_DN93639_c0_g1~~TRINITY_DN93639_c0_g1_i1.p1  ORF type:complete len:712 (+),score=203.40 TRINITY_DN93639_c0_g1_i1:109-2136(+)